MLVLAFSVLNNRAEILRSDGRLMAASGEPKKRGPKAGIKHQPGRGHNRKSGPSQKRRFMRRAAHLRQAQEEKTRKQWQDYDRLPEEVKKLRPDLLPETPRPDND
jgi:hypothetical protein